MRGAARSRLPYSRATVRRRVWRGFRRRTAPSRSRRAGSRRTRAPRRARARTPAAAGAACGVASSATGRESRRGCRRAKRSGIMRSTTSTASWRSTRTFASLLRVDAAQQGADARLVHLDAEKIHARMRSRDRGGRLAHAEPDFEHDRATRCRRARESRAATTARRRSADKARRRRAAARAKSGLGAARSCGWADAPANRCRRCDHSGHDRCRGRLRQRSRPAPITSRAPSSTTDRPAGARAGAARRH